MNNPEKTLASGVAPSAVLNDQIAAKLRGEPVGLFLSELFQGGGQLALMLLLLELVTEWLRAWSRPDIWVLLVVAVGQSAWLARLTFKGREAAWWSRLLGLVVYAVVESVLEGPHFFLAPHHISFAVLSLVYALGMHMQSSRRLGVAVWGTVLARMAQALGPMLYYLALDLHGRAWAVGVVDFFDSSAHVFLLILAMAQAAALVALSWVGRRQDGVIQQLVFLLKQLSSWGYGDQVVGRVLQSGQTEQAQRIRRTIAFIDVRGFTLWSEAHPPETVVAMLNGFYDAVLAGCGGSPIKAKLTGDEVLLVLESGPQAVAQVESALRAARQALLPWGLDAGAGVWQGLVVEGFLGAHQLQVHDVIGDTVNTAHRLCSQAKAGQMVIGTDMAHNLTPAMQASREMLQVRGKVQPLDITRCNLF